jgi:hypothetical protein
LKRIKEDYLKLLMLLRNLGMTYGAKGLFRKITGGELEQLTVWEE